MAKGDGHGAVRAMRGKAQAQQSVVRGQETEVAYPSEVVAWGKGEEAWRSARRRARCAPGAARRGSMREAAMERQPPRNCATKQSAAD